MTAVGLTGDAGYDFVLAVHELATNAVRHGGGRGHLELRRQDDVLTCEIIDQGPAPGHLPVRLPAVDTAGGRGLWLAHQLTEGLILTRRLDGVTATVTACLEPTISDHTAAARSRRRTRIRLRRAQLPGRRVPRRAAAPVAQHAGGRWGRHIVCSLGPPSIASFTGDPVDLRTLPASTGGELW
ncbi:ATP-binding protein [Micromonospora sp. A200]|uniref:ATP-binding protein n=1 Tax=Micromonospora sp. A200 TaxID=2940568 RepID=UPI002474CCEF|nr:ATP-binding protein [Micromonospora sp. A200]